MSVSNGYKLGQIVGSPYEGYSLLCGRTLFVRVAWNDGSWNDCRLNKLMIADEVSK